MNPCPPRHVTYDSQALAENAATLHHWAYPGCPGFKAWRHDDHWHVGHTSSKRGDVCKSDPEHNATRRRINSALNRWK